MEGVFVQLGVNISGLKEAMSEDVSHLFETDSPPDHSRCRRMPESMRTQPGDQNPGHFEVAFRDATHRTGACNRAKWCAGT